MSSNRPTLPAYIRLPDGLRFAGSADLDEQGRLCFYPKQAISTVPPEGLPVHLLVVGLPGDEDAQLSIAGTTDEVNARLITILPDDTLPDLLIEALDPDSIIWLPNEDEAARLLEEMREHGRSEIMKALRRFLVDLGDHLFDLSTSSRYGISGQHAHYDALNMLKRNSDSFSKTFEESLLSSLGKLEKISEGQTFADLEAASARNLDLVALDEMDQKLAVDKIVSSLIEIHRVDLECLTIRAALVADLEPRKAQTPFHPAYIVQALMDAFHDVSDSVEVIRDTLAFFRDSYTPLLDKLYPSLNKIFADAGIEPGLEEDIRDNGSLLNPVEKRIIKSTVRSRPSEEKESVQAATGTNQNSARDDGTGPSPVQNKTSRGSDSDRSENDAEKKSEPSIEGVEGTLENAAPKNRHDAMYDAVLHALNTNREGTAAEHDNEEGGSDGADDSTEATHTAAETGSGTGAGASAAKPASAPATTLDQNALLSLLQVMQNATPAADSLGDLPPLEELVKEHLGADSNVGVGSDGANRLSFVDNVFRTLHNNFEVSADMAPSLSRLRVPLARLSLQEPRFFTQPEHPAHQLLDKLSVLASADHTVNRTLQGKVASIVDRIADDYKDDSTVFAEAQKDLDNLLTQQDRTSSRNIERVVSGLEGQEKLVRAQRRVEKLLSDRLDSQRSPKALLDLVNGGWRSALVQLALREGEDSVAWKEEAALLDTLVKDFGDSESGELPESRLREMQVRLRALNKRLHTSNPGSIAHEAPIRHINSVLTGQAPLATLGYASPLPEQQALDARRIEKLPRLRRWMQRVNDLEPGARLRYRDKDGRRRHMKLVWISDAKDRFVFVNERGQKIAELSNVQLARQLSRGAQPPTRVDDMSVLDQSMYETLEQAQKTLSFDRNRDSLTQLINGESLLYQLQRSLRHAQTRGSEHTFILLDIDNFALVNQVFDETSGDQVLTEFANMLGQLNDRRALTARIEEDEFGILLTYRSTQEGRSIAEKIRNDIAESSLTINDEAVSFTVSMGIAAVAESSESPESIMNQARSALALAKNQGRDQVVIFDVDQEELLRFREERDASRKRLDDAMSTDALVLRAQPIVKSAIDGSVNATHHYEILLAIRDDDGELQSPLEFIRSAERFGYVTLVDRWVLRETFAWISGLMDAQKEIPELSINLSGTSITDNSFLDYVLEQISEYGVGTSKLCFEITETGAIDNLPLAADFVRTLKNIGCKFSLDDFGTGLASHKYLKELPVDYVKIDGTFITDVHHNRTDFAMAKSINDLAHFLGQKTIAECVENLDMVPALREIGIDYLQGWGIGMPRELSAIVDELDNLET